MSVFIYPELLYEAAGITTNPCRDLWAVTVNLKLYDCFTRQEYRDLHIEKPKVF